MSIASNLRREMDARGVGIDALAAEISCDASSVRKYLSGKIRPSDGVLARISRALGCEAADLKFGRRSGRSSGKLTTAEVARETGIDPLSLRIGCQRGIYPFGTAYKRPGSGKYTYVYDPAGVRRWAEERKAITGGITTDETGERISAAGA